MIDDKEKRFDNYLFKKMDRRHAKHWHEDLIRRGKREEAREFLERVRAVKCNNLESEL